MKIKLAILLVIYFANYLAAAEDLAVGRVHVVNKNVSLRGIYAVSEREVWISGSRGSVYFTLDGGRSWQKSEIPGGGDLDFRDIEILGDGAIVLMSAGPGNKSRIFRSTDKGKGWSEVFSNSYEKGFLNTIAFWNHKDGMGIGDPINGRFYLILTSNGGKTWRELEWEQCPPAEPGEAGFAASGTCIAVAGRNNAWIGSGGKTARVFFTNDRGKSWRIFVSPILQGEASTGIFSVFFKDKMNGVIVGGDYKKINKTNKTIAFTNDQGKTWQAATDAGLPFLSSVKGVVIKGKSCHLATGPAGVYLVDNNYKWEQVSGRGFHCLSVDEKGESAWLAGSNGRVAAIRIPRK